MSAHIVRVAGIPGWPDERDGWVRGHELRWHHGALEKLLISLSAPPRRPPVLLGSLSQPWWQRRVNSGWFCLTLKIKTGTSFWDAMLVPLGLFNNAFDSVIDRNQEDRRQAVALQRFLPCHPPAQVAAGREQPQLHASSSYREAQRQSVATRDPPMVAWHVQSLSIP